MRKKLITRKHREWLFGYLFIGIWVIGFLIFSVIPIIQSFYYSTKNVRISSDGLQVVQNLGFKNYKDAIFMIYYIEALWDYVSKTLVTIPMIIVFSIIIALLLNKNIKFRGLFRTIYFLPVIISSGPVLTKINEQGASNIPSLIDEKIIVFFQDVLPAFLTSILNILFEQIVMIMWFTGVPVLIFIAGLQKIDRNVYEAASIDGASSWESFWKITLPSLKPLINVNIVYTIVAINIFSSNTVMSIIDARKLTQFGYANALAWIYFFVTVLLLGILLLIINIKRPTKRSLTRRKVKKV